jgi:hypothetical protein
MTIYNSMLIEFQYFFRASLHLDSPNLEIIDNIFDRFGPTPRLCFDVLSNNEWFKKHGDETQRALDGLTMENLRTSINDLEGLKMNAIWDKLCLIRRSKKHDLDSDTLVMPITDYIRSELVIRLQKSSLRQLIETYHKFFPMHPLRGMCGAIFESICHRRFQEQIFIRYMRMVRLPAGGSKLHSSHHTIENQDLEERREVAFHESVILNVRPSRARVYDGQGLDPEPGVYYYLAQKPSQAALDSFILYDDILYIFRFTVSDEQGIKEGLIAECAKLSIPEGKRLFIFVIPDGVKLLKCPYPKSLELQRFEPCSAQIVMENLAWSIKEGEKEPLFKKPKIAVAT